MTDHASAIRAAAEIVGLLDRVDGPPDLEDRITAIIAAEYAAEAPAPRADESALVEMRPMPRGGMEPNWWEEWVKVVRKNRLLVKALEAHHKWHMDKGVILKLPDGDGGFVEIDNAAAYSDSSLYEQTVAALAARRPGGEEG